MGTITLILHSSLRIHLTYNYRFIQPAITVFFFSLLFVAYDGVVTCYDCLQENLYLKYNSMKSKLKFLFWIILH